MKWKKILQIGSLLTTMIPIFNVACLESAKDSFTKKHNYDFGFATHDISSLNYIKFKGSAPFGRSVVETFKKNAPEKESALASHLTNVPKFYSRSSRRYLASLLNRYSMTSGVLKSQIKIKDRVPYTGIESYSSKSNLFVLRLNGKSKWSNGDYVKTSDFIDAFVYVLDLNTGSQMINEFLGFNIMYSDEFVAAQMSYAKKYKKLYKNPFGYIKNENYDEKYKNSSEEDKKHLVYWVQRKGVFPNQIYNKTKAELKNMNYREKNDYLKNQKEETKLISEIAFYAKNLGVYGDLNSSHPYNHIEDIKKEKIKDPYFSTNKYCFYDDYSIEKEGEETIYPYLLQIRTNLKVGLFNYFINGIFRSSWIPVNRKFVEEIGGIEKFGLDDSKFLTQGPFKISKMVLGRGGSIDLERNLDYWDNKNTIPNKVKIYFQSDPVVTFSLFEDGYISLASIDAIAARNLYSDSKYRKLVKKSPGVGTAGFTFNIDSKSRGYNPIIGSRNLRKAIFYAINRNDTIKLSAFDSTLPQYALVDSSASQKSHWISLNGGISSLQLIGDSIYYDKYQANQAKKMFPYKINDNRQKRTFIGNFDKTDRFLNYKLARKYFAAFLEEYPLTGSKKQHTIVYNHDSTKVLLQIGIALQTAVKKAFGNKLVIKIKGYPKSVYETYYQTGNFQMTWLNMDFLMNSDASSGGTGAFLLQDGILKEEQKTIGFLKNPTGNWTFAKVVKNKTSELSDEEKEIKKRLEIKDFVWDKIYDLSRVPDNLYQKSKRDQTIFLERKIRAFFAITPFTFSNTKYPVAKNFSTLHNITEFVKATNKLIMEASPVIPLFVVDNFIEVSRTVNLSIWKTTPSFDYAYDYKFPPLKNLPGYEAI